MSDNKREMMKITIESPGKETRVIECDGIAGVTAKDLDEKHHEMNCILAGSFSPADLVMLHRAVIQELIPLIENNINNSNPPTHANAGDFLRALADMLEE